MSDNGEVAWDRWFLRLRQLNHVQQLGMFLMSLYILVQMGLTGSLYFSDEEEDLVSQRSFLRMLHVVGALAEINVFVGSVWLIKPGRRLAMWPLSWFPARVGDSCLKHAGLHNGFVAVSLLLLAAAAFFEDLLPVALVSVTVASTLDLWRFLYSTYWMAGLFLLTFTEDVRVGLVIIYASLYFWTGLFKLTSRGYHESVVPMTFAPIFKVIPWLGDGWRRAIVGGAAVALEAGLGVGIAVAPFVAYVAFRQLILAFNIFMHVYIVLGIGWYNSIQTFWSWNALCTALVATLLGGPLEFEASALLHPAVVAVFLLMNVPPVLQMLGRLEYGSLSHSWFVPGASGRQTLVFRYEAAASLPTEENGFPVELFRDNSIHRVAKIVGGYRELAKHLQLELPSGIDDGSSEDESEGHESKLAVAVTQRVASIDGSWLDNVYRMHAALGDDPCRETFGAGPGNWWCTVVRRHLKVPTLRLVEMPPQLLAPERDTVDLIIAGGERLTRV